MESRVNYIMAGLFVLVLATVAVVGGLWLGASGLPQEWERYLVYSSESVAGLDVDSAVLYRGVKVGRVETVEIDPENPERVRIVLAVEVGTPVKGDTVAVIQTRGLTGIAHINLTGGSAGAPPPRTPAGEPYPVVDIRRSLMQELEDAAMELAGSLGEAGERINRLLSDENQARVSRSLQRLDAFTHMLAQQQGEIERGIADLNALTAGLREDRRAIGPMLEQGRASAEALEAMAQALAQAGAQAGELVGSGKAQLQRFDRTWPEVQALLRELRLGAQNLRRVSERLEADPSTLIYGPAPQAPGPGE